MTRAIGLYTARQVVDTRVSRYSDEVFKALVWLGRAEEALSHARLRRGASTRFTSIPGFVAA